MSFAAEQKFSVTLGNHETETLSFRELLKDKKTIYIASYRSSKYGEFSRAIPKSYFKESSNTLKGWLKKMPLIDPNIDVSTCGDQIFTMINKDPELYCFQSLNLENRKKFLTWFADNVKLTQLKYGGTPLQPSTPKKAKPVTK